MKKVLSWFLDLLKGFGIGIACIIPGVSGGTFALLVNCYDKLISSISDLFKNFVKNFLILLPIGIGILIGILVGYIGISRAFDYILFTIICLFAGLILGSVPSLVDEVSHEPFSPTNLLVGILAFIFVVAIAIISFIIKVKYPDYSISTLFDKGSVVLYFLMIPVGVIGSFALVTPGISGSMLLLVLGFYEPLLDTIHDLFHFVNPLQNVFIILSFAVGVIIGFFLMSKLMKYLLTKHRTLTYYAIIGFVMGSLLAIFVNPDIYLGKGVYLGIIQNPIELAIGIPLFIVGAVGSYILIRLARKRGKVNA